MTTPHDKALAPCPFCGRSATIEQIGNSWQSTIYQCDNCGCSLETGEEFDHGKLWNTRAPIPEAGNGDGWLPIETAPKDGTQVLCAFFSWGEPDKGYSMEVVSWMGDCWASEAYPIYPPTHWRPLPSPPSIRSSDTGREE